jgi:hypothetical protein
MLALSASAMALSLSVQGLVVAHGPFGALAALRALSAPGGPLDPARGALCGWLPSVGHVAVMRLMNGLYSHVAAALTDFENHRTETDAANALLLKRFGFEAFDAYGTLLYIALAKRDVHVLRAELIGLYSTDAARRILTEAALPWAQQRLGGLLARRARRTASPRPGAETPAAPLTPPALTLSEPAARRLAAQPSTPLSPHPPPQAQPPPPEAASSVALLGGGEGSRSADSSGDARAAGGRWASELALCEYEAFDDQLEMVLQLGYVLLFAAAFPLAGCLSLVCTAVEFQSDLWRLSHVARRPPPSRARDLGAWLWVLGALSLAAVPTNLAIAAYASDQLEQFLPAGFFVPNAERLASAAPRAAWLSGGARALLAGVRCALPSARRGGCGAPRASGGPASADDFALDDVAPGARASVALALLAVEHALALCALLLAAALPTEPEEVSAARARSAWVTSVKARAARRGGGGVESAAQRAADEQGADSGAVCAAPAEVQLARGFEAASSFIARLMGSSRGGSGLLMRRRLSSGAAALVDKPTLTVAVPSSVAGLTPGPGLKPKRC